MPSRLKHANRKAAGTAFERVVRDDLQQAGYRVIRAGASLGAADLVAFKAFFRAGPVLCECLLIQCKRDGSLRPREWSMLLDLAQETGTLPILAFAGATVKEALYHRLLKPKARGKAAHGQSIPFYPNV